MSDVFFYKSMICLVLVLLQLNAVGVCCGGCGAVSRFSLVML